MKSNNDPLDCAETMCEKVSEIAMHIENVRYYREMDLSEKPEHYQSEAFERLMEMNDLIGEMEELIDDLEPSEEVEVQLLEELDN